MCFGSRDKGDGGLARSRDIDKQIRQDEKKMSKEVKLLLLGTSDSYLAGLHIVGIGCGSADTVC